MMPTPAAKLAGLNKDTLKLFQLKYYERSSYLEGIELLSSSFRLTQ